MPKTVTLTLYQGNAETIPGSVVDSSGAPVDLTGATVDWVMQRREADTTPLIHKSSANGGISIDTGTGGTYTLNLLATDTKSVEQGTYYHEVRITDASGQPFTATQGKATVIATAASL